MRKLLIGAALASSMLFATQSDAKKQPQMTPMELQALQSHEYETTKEVLFASVVSVFQDLGYQLENADMGSGFITASSATHNKTGLFEAFAGVNSSGNTRATAFVEAMPSGMARVRLNFLNSKSSSSRWGQQNREDKPVLDAQTYQAAWAKIDEAIFTRAATAGTARAAAPVTPQAAATTAPTAPRATVTPASATLPH